MGENVRVFCDLPKEEFYIFVNEAKRTNTRCDEDGRVNVGGLLADLMREFAKGKITLQKKE